MTGWEQTLQQLREDFLRGTVARFERIESGLARLGSVPGDAQALADLRLAFHGFSGIGGSFGFPKVSKLGQDGEDQCETLRAEGRVPGEAEFIAWRGVLDDLRSELGQRQPAPRGVPSSRAPIRGEALVVVADSALCTVLAGVVERAGLSVRCAMSRVEALAALETLMPAAALVDADLPDGSGYALVERIRATPGGEAIPVLLVAGVAGVSDRVEAIHCGADGLFEAPLDPEIVGRKLEQLLERAGAEAPRVLSVEDTQDQGGFIRSVLESAGYEVCVATGARGFEEALTAFRPDLVLMGSLLPGGVSGYGLARFLRQDERYAALPVLFLTVEPQMHAPIEAVSAGGDDHLAQPIAPGLLLSTVAARIARARSLKDLAERDGLTGLLVHSAFLERVRSAHSRCLRHPEGHQAALVVLDLDHFKKINDTWGYPIGDRVLTALSGLLRTQLRQTDSIGRLGGGEFGVLLQEPSAEGALPLVERLLADFAAIDHRGTGLTTFRATFSAGVARSDTAPDLPSWLEAAGGALYEAKQGGPNFVVAFSSVYHASLASAD